MKQEKKQYLSGTHLSTEHFFLVLFPSKVSGNNSQQLKLLNIPFVIKSSSISFKKLKSLYVNKYYS